MISATRWFLLVVASSVAALLAVIAATGDAISMVPLLWFLGVIPGLPYVRMLRNTADPVTLWITAVGLSVAIDSVVATALLYTHTFTAATAVVVLAFVAYGGAAIGYRGQAQSPESAETT